MLIKISLAFIFTIASLSGGAAFAQSSLVVKTGTVSLASCSNYKNKRDCISKKCSAVNPTACQWNGTSDDIGTCECPPTPCKASGYPACGGACATVNGKPGTCKSGMDRSCECKY